MEADSYQSLRHIIKSLPYGYKSFCTVPTNALVPQGQRGIGLVPKVGYDFLILSVGEGLIVVGLGVEVLVSKGLILSLDTFFPTYQIFCNITSPQGAARGRKESNNFR